MSTNGVPCKHFHETIKVLQKIKNKNLDFISSWHSQSDCLVESSVVILVVGTGTLGNSLVLPYGVGIVGMVGNELGKIHEAQFFPN